MARRSRRAVVHYGKPSKPWMSVTGFKHAEEVFRLVMEVSPNALVVVNSEGLITLVNPQTETVFGYTQAELLGQSVELLVPQRYHAHHPGMRHGFMAGPTSRVMGKGRELFGRRKDGSEVPVEISLAPIRTHEGTSVLATITDMTERNQAENRFRGFLDSTSELLWCVEFKEPIPLDLPEEEQVERILRDGFYSEVNEALAKAYGATVAEVIGWPVEKTLQRSLPTTIPILREVVQSGYSLSGADTVEVTKDGTEIHLSNSFTPIIAGGRVFRLWGTARDVTKRALAEREVRRMSDFYRTVLDSMRSHIAILDPEGIIVDVNDAWNEFALANGASPSEVGIGRSYLEACEQAASEGDTIAQRVVDGFRSVLGGAREYFEIEYPCHSPTESRWFWLRAKLLKNVAQGVVVSHVNISELRLAQQALAQQRDELAHLSRVSVLGEVSGSLAHELNQPLGAILANAQAARRWLTFTPPNLEETRSAIEHIIQDDKRAGEIVHRVRALAKRDTPDRQLLDMTRVASDTAALLHSEMVAADVPLTLELQPDLPAVRAGQVELQQALLNLMLNGLQAQSETERSRRGLTITIHHEDGTVVTTVRDRGPGLSPDIMPRLFDAFYTTKPGGIGLGLAFCQRIAETHSGRLWAENHPDGGAVFFFTLPAHTPPS